MAKDMFWTVTTFAIIIAVLALAFWPQDKAVIVVKYNCHQLNNVWHPEILAAVQEECKKRGVTK